jgi:NAD(P)-dependent dehydrogenase (short-subunit alcohol dehydrogenase family)
MRDQVIVITGGSGGFDAGLEQIVAARGGRQARP